MPEPELGRADLHVHPAGNGLARGDPAAFLDALAGAGLDLVGLTDHDRIDVALELVVRGQDAGLHLVVGEEISAREGHVIGLGLRALVAPDRSLGDTIAAVHDQGGLAIVAHPMLAVPGSASARVLRALADGPPARRPDAIEAFNARAAWVPGHRGRLGRLATEAGYATTGSSDAHWPGNVGRAYTRYPGRSMADLTVAIGCGLTVAGGRPSGIADLLRDARHGGRRPRR